MTRPKIIVSFRATGCLSASRRTCPPPPVLDGAPEDAGTLAQATTPHSPNWEQPKPFSPGPPAGAVDRPSPEAPDQHPPPEGSRPGAELEQTITPRCVTTNRPNG